MNIVVIGAHPDDGEVHAGAAGLKWAGLGHRVVMVSLTNGDVGHHEMAGGPLAQRRRAESREAARRGGFVDVVFDEHDGELLPTLDLRKQVIRLIRRFEADLVLTHRPNDYHPDHRYASILVQDAAFMVTVPHMCPDTPALRRNPVFMYLMDAFCKPAPFTPDVAVDATDVLARKFDLIDAMASQCYEWLPWLEGRLDDVPADPAARRAWLETAWTPFFAPFLEMGRPALERWYGPKQAARAQHVELFEVCEYGARPTEADLRRLFPFLGAAR